MNPPRPLRGLLRKARGPGAQTLGASLASQGLTLITGVIAARALGAEGRGTLALLWLVPATLVLLGGLGIPQATTYYVARESRHARSVVKISARITMMLALGLACAYGIGLWILATGSDHHFSTLDGFLSLALVPMLLAQNLGVAALLGRERYRAFNGARLGPVFVYAVVSLFLLAVGQATLTSILAACLAAWGMGAIVTWYLLNHYLPTDDGALDTTREEIVKFGLRGVIGSVSPIDDVRVDQLLVGLILDARALGLYVAAVAFCNLPRFVAQSIGSVSFPRIAAARDSVLAWGLVGHYLKLGLAAIGITVGALVLVVPSLLPFMFGDEFADAVPLGRILLLSAFFLALHRLLTELARGLGHPGYGSITEAVNALVFLVCAFLIFDPISAKGVAWAVLAGGVVCSGLLLGLILRLRKIGLPGVEAQEGERASES